MEKDATLEGVIPPWKEFPGHPPGDTFWRQTGELWFHYVWKPFWGSLDTIQQENYLKYWSVPYEWEKFYFDEDFQNFLQSCDED